MLVHTKKMKSPLEKFIAKLKILNSNKNKKKKTKKKSKPKPCNCGCGGN